jgi:tRNA-dihydrouridine synthase B
VHCPVAPCAPIAFVYSAGSFIGDEFLSTPDSRRLGSLQIGEVTLRGRAFLAPMSGVTDLPFRRLAHRFGAALVVSEMVACDQALLGSEESRLRTEGEGLDIHVVQLVGRDPEAFREGVRVAEAAGAHIIDINMGCPAKKVVNGYAGSALMREADLAIRIIEATVKAATVPVTLKMRLGWDHASLNAADIARRAEAAGVQLVTVHGRTRCQFYNGAADWSAIRAIKESVKIPVVANGDLLRAEDAPAMLAASCADAVMIGRGTYGRPWLVGQTADALAGRTPRDAPVGEALREIVLEHYEMILNHYGIPKGVRVARKHLGWYFDRLTHVVPAALRGAIMQAEDSRLVTRLLTSALAPAEAIAA